jgi:hypothetical protein
MTAKEFLMPLKTMQTDIETKKDQLIFLRESLKSITLRYGEKIGCSGSINTHSMSKRICDVIDVENELMKSVEKLVAMQSCIISAINEIEDIDCRAILHWRYLKHLAWSEIAEKIHMTEDGVYKKHRKALSELEKTKNFKNWAVEGSSGQLCTVDILDKK